MHQRPPGRPVGGSGALTAALAQRGCEPTAAGCGSATGPRSIEIADGRVSAVLTASGERLPTSAVVSACHVLTTVELAAARPAARRSPSGPARAIRVGNGIGVALAARHDATCPTTRMRPPTSTAGLGLLAPDRRDAGRAPTVTTSADARRRSRRSS